MAMMRRIFRWGFWLLLVILLLGTIAWTVANVVGTSRLNEAIASARREGYATSPSDLAPPPATAEENAAPFYSAAFALMAEPPEILSGAQERGFASLNAGEKAELRGWLAKQRDSFDLIRRARSRPRCRFDRDYSLGYNMPLPELSKAIRVTKILAVRIEALEEEGKQEEARESVRDACGTADCAREDAILVCQLVRIVTWTVVMRTIDRCVTAETKEADLRAWLELLPSETRFDGMMEHAMRGELALGAEVASESPELILEWGNRGLLNRVGPILLHPVIKISGARHLDTLRRLIALRRKPHPEAQTEADRIEREALEGPRWTNIVTALLLPATGRAFRNHAELIARLRVLRAGLRCEIARAAGGYPAEVEGADPFTGGPLIYRDGKIACPAPEGCGPIEWKLRRP
ncbi:MAG: hypothetical protein HYY17_10490 [Planctomycetes bacterium]|nr:hypothetical protein [Planctomycetota bacterium]